ncbi:MAG TPA: SDR family NAD(P)-dependent oxidoreductase [Hyphomicrobiaceae bacterium]|nr:SDR family NAD(P)-dependent oxidoreductase [Hyphomicrobiaceae bacterium]
MTGGTRGFGRRMVERLLAEQPDWRVILLARPSAHVSEFAATADPARLSVVDADLANLASVARSMSAVTKLLDGEAIDAVALNAGLQAVDGDRFSADGLELSFAVNHLAHFFIASCLAPHIRTGGRLIFTSSEVHDPEAFCLMGIARAVWQSPDVLADGARSQTHLPEGVERGEARYSASKLLNLMSARHFAATEPRFSTYAFNPSVVPGTDIARERNILQILSWKYLLPALAPVLPGARSIGRSAGDLLWLATEADAETLRGHYVDGRTVQAGSDESRDPEKIEAVAGVSRALIARHLAETPRVSSLSTPVGSVEDSAA